MSTDREMFCRVVLEAQSESRRAMAAYFEGLATRNWSIACRAMDERDAALTRVAELEAQVERMASPCRALVPAGGSA